MGYERVRTLFGKLGRRVASAAFAMSLVIGAGAVMAEGSVSLYPSGYSGARANLNASTNVYFGDVQDPSTLDKRFGIKARTFLYVYAQPGEKLWLGSSGTGAIRVFGPVVLDPLKTPAANKALLEAVYGRAGFEDTTPTLIYECSNPSGRIESRAQEIAGPNAGGGFTPCEYVVPAGGGGVYGVLFEGGGSATTAPDADINSVAARSSSVAAWDVTVVSSTNVKILGRLFTYAFAGYTGSNGLDRRLNSTLYYATDDGYRYSQKLTNFDPNAYVMYSNARGFLDTNGGADAGEPLYRSVRGAGTNSYLGEIVQKTVGTGEQDDAGIVPDLPQYPIFFTNVASTAPGTPGDNGCINPGVCQTLTYLGINLEPPQPLVESVSFSPALPPGASGTAAYVGQGGTFQLDLLDTTSYSIVIGTVETSVGSGLLDPAAPKNRLLRGSGTGTVSVAWDGRANDGTLFPASSTGYNFSVTGNNGEVHFPFLDAEANVSGGPAVTQLNGQADGNTTVYYDDRGYRTRSGAFIGAPDGALCAGGVVGPQPVEPFSLEGVDSTTEYRVWGGTVADNSGINDGRDCFVANQFFGDQKGLDLWAYQVSAPLGDAGSPLVVRDYFDVTSTVSAPSQILPGGVVTSVLRFGNVGSEVASGIQYRAELAAGLSGVSCSGAVCAYDPSTGDVVITGLPVGLAPGQWTEAISLSYPAPGSGTIEVRSTISAGGVESDFAPNTATADTDVVGTVTEFDLETVVTLPSTAVAGQSFNGTVRFRNLSSIAATGTTTYTVALTPGLTSVTCGAAPLSCTYNAVTGGLTVTGLPPSPPGGSDTLLNLTITPATVGVVRVESTVSNAVDVNPGNNSSVRETNILASGASIADGTVDIATVPQALTGSTVTATVTFRNNSAQALTDVTYTITGIPSDATVDCGVGCIYDPATGALSGGSLPATLNAASSVPVTISYTAPEPGAGPVTLSATIAADNDSNNANNNATSTTSFLQLTLSGVVFNDNGAGGGVANDGLRNGTEPGTNAGGVNVVILDSSNRVVAVAPVAPDGSWTANVDPGTGYSAYLSTESPNLGDTVDPVSVRLRAGWSISGEGGGVRSGINVSTASVAQLDFGVLGTTVTPIPILSPLGLLLLVLGVGAIAARSGRQRIVR